MHYFKYRRGRLYCEDVPLESLCRKYGTPLYVYSKATLKEHFRKLTRAFSGLDTLVCYSVKANSNLSIIRFLDSLGAGFDVVSGGELYRLKKLGVNPSKIVYAGVGKTEEEIKQALRHKIYAFNVESLQELGLVDKLAGRFRKGQKVCLRFNPYLKGDYAHRYTTTAKKENKFGLNREEVLKVFAGARRYPNLDICGIHIHIGSQISDPRPFTEAIKKAGKMVSYIKKHYRDIEIFNIGGGLAAQYKDRETPQTAERFARSVKGLLKSTGARIVLEPGRFIVANAGVLATRVLYTKSTQSKNFCIVDAGMNDLIRPSLYEAYHNIDTLVKKRPAKTYDIVGPICETGDFLGKERRLPVLESGDLLCVFSSGAYGMSMASNYNTRPICAEVMVNGRRSVLIRKRQTPEDIMRNEKIQVA